MTAFIWSNSNSDGTPPKYANDASNPRITTGIVWRFVEPQPHPPRIAQHHDQRVPLAPRQPEVGEVHLALVAR